MKNNKIIIIITLIISMILALAIGFTTYRITLNNRKQDNSEKTTANSLKVGNYTLQYGKYKGYSVEYEWDDKKDEPTEIRKDEIVLILNNDNTYELSGEKHKFTVVATDIIVPDFNNISMFKAIGNNKIELMIGSGVELTYSNE